LICSVFSLLFSPSVTFGTIRGFLLYIGHSHHLARLLARQRRVRLEHNLVETLFAKRTRVDNMAPTLFKKQTLFSEKRDQKRAPSSAKNAPTQTSMQSKQNVCEHPSTPTRVVALLRSLRQMVQEDIAPLLSLVFQKKLAKNTCFCHLPNVVGVVTLDSSFIF
jgi:hypothetical protein